jgi:hypothetical protein
MNMPSRPRAEPFSKPPGLVTGVIVHDQVNVETVRQVALDPAQEAEKLAAASAGMVTPDDPACRREGPRADGRFCARLNLFRCLGSFFCNSQGRKAATPAATAEVPTRLRKCHSAFVPHCERRHSRTMRDGVNLTLTYWR